jgi:hypothetical protein
MRTRLERQKLATTRPSGASAVDFDGLRPDMQTRTCESDADAFKPDPAGRTPDHRECENQGQDRWDVTESAHVAARPELTSTKKSPATTQCARFDGHASPRSSRHHQRQDTRRPSCPLRAISRALGRQRPVSLGKHHAGIAGVAFPCWSVSFGGWLFAVLMPDG